MNQINMHVGLYFGSFNPVHIGHLAIANYMLEFTNIDKLWFVVSPQNPFKNKKTLLPAHHRFEMLYQVIKDDDNMSVCDVELKMPQPSYTIDTLTYLSEKHPNHTFSIIMGSDSLPTFHKWKNADIIIEKYHRFVYPRHEPEEIDFSQHKNITVVNAPKIEISSSFIRSAIKKGKEVKYFLPMKAYQYVNEMNFYKDLK